MSRRFYTVPHPFDGKDVRSRETFFKHCKKEGALTVVIKAYFKLKQPIQCMHVLDILSDQGI